MHSRFVLYLSLKITIFLSHKKINNNKAPKLGNILIIFGVLYDTAPLTLQINVIIEY